MSPLVAVRSVNLAAFGGSGSSHTGFAGSTTYGGVSMTELWDQVNSNDAAYFHAGYALAGISSGASTVTNTISSTPGRQAFGVITMTGVDQTTPAGTAVVTDVAINDISVTVASVGADDLVCDNLWSRGGVTIGADQTLRNTDEPLVGILRFRQSTQPGTAGGVMSWSSGSGETSALGAVAFKPAAAADGWGPLIGLRNNRLVGAP